MSSEEVAERNRQNQRNQRAARKLFWQTLIANKDGYDTIVCVVCGLPETDPHNPLTYSHNDPATKSFNLSEAIVGGFLRKTHEEIEVEARKCSLRHHRCHKIFDNGTVYGSDGISHGLTGYQYGCRCGICVAAYRDAYQRRVADPVKRVADNKRRRNLRINNPMLEAERKRDREAKRDLRARKKVAKGVAT